MTLSNCWSRTSVKARGLALATLTTGVWALSAGMTQAQARDVYWSIGVSQPGVSVGVSNAPPLVVYPYQIHELRPIVIHQRQVLLVQKPVYYSDWSHGPRWDERRHRHHQKWRKHHDRDDDDDDDDDRRGHGRR